MPAPTASHPSTGPSSSKYARTSTATKPNKELVARKPSFPAGGRNNSRSTKGCVRARSASRSSPSGQRLSLRACRCHNRRVSHRNRCRSATARRTGSRRPANANNGGLGASGGRPAPVTSPRVSASLPPVPERLGWPNASRRRLEARGWRRAWPTSGGAPSGPHATAPWSRDTQGAGSRGGVALQFA